MMILALQKLSNGQHNAEQFDSTQSHCCAGSTQSIENCCNEGPVKPPVEI